MITTFVCEKEGCSGNKFYIETIDDKIQVTCIECNKKYLFRSNLSDCAVVSSCTGCNNDTFKLYKDDKNEIVYAKCIKCGEVPEKIYIDSDGTQISYNEKLLNDIKILMNMLEQRICNLDQKIQGVERGQCLLEESIAYINKYIIKKI